MSNVIGIDIGVGSTKVVSLAKVDKGIVLDVVGETKTPNSVWTQGDPKKMAEVAGAIKLLMADLKIRAKQAVVSLPEDEVV